MDYVLGIDSGGTNYRVEAQDTDGHQLGYYVGQPVNHYNFAKEEWQNRINENIDACLAQFGGQRSKVKALVCGTTGIDSDADEVMLNAFYRSLPGFACPMQVVNDAELAHYTVTGGTGVLVISGTGSIAYGRSRDGRTCRTGGWMFTIEGDEGSGTWVSRMALRQVGRYLEGAAPESPLTRAVCATLSIHTRDDLNSVALAGGQAPWGMPHLGKLVNESAEEGDVAAVKILQQAAGLIRHLRADLCDPPGLGQALGDDAGQRGHVHVAAKVVILDRRDGAGETMRRFHKAGHCVACAGAREAQQVLAASGDGLADAGQSLGIGGKHIVRLV